MGKSNFDRTPPQRVFYAAGPGDAISAHRYWREGANDPTEVSITFSSQIEDYCRDVGAKLWIVAHPSSRDRLDDGEFTLEHLPKLWPNARGLAYHVRELLYGLSLLRRAVRHRADLAILDSGCTQYFTMGLFALCGMRVVPVLHNALWQDDKISTGVMARIVKFLDSLFWRYGPLVTLCVSPVSAAQVKELGGSRARPTRQFRAQFRPDFFKRIPPAPPHSRRPFQIMFVGRVTEAKGVFHLLEMARAIETARPGVVRWTLCGTGADLEELRLRTASVGLTGVVDIRGWVSPEDQVALYARSHCSIIPSIATEGLPMTAVESLLAGRPIITSPAALTLDAMAASAVVCQRGDVASYVDGILRLLDDPALYERLAANCASITPPFVDRKFGLSHVLKTLFRA